MAFRPVSRVVPFSEISACKQAFAVREFKIVNFALARECGFCPCFSLAGAQNVSTAIIRRKLDACGIFQMHGRNCLAIAAEKQPYEHAFHKPVSH